MSGEQPANTKLTQSSNFNILSTLRYMKSSTLLDVICNRICARADLNMILKSSVADADSLHSTHVAHY
jgi:hypothetical protein